jgi:serine/threonine protein kinase
MEREMIYDILLEKYKNVKLKELNIGYTNKMVLLEGSIPEVVAKIFAKEQYKNNNSCKNEINALIHLKNINITPKLYDYFEDDTFEYMIMEYINGINGQIFLDNGNIDEAKKIYKLLGIHLAKDIHSIKREDNNLDLSVIRLVNTSDKFIEYVPINLKDIVTQINNVQDKEPQTLIHGDYGPHNIIFSKDTIIAVDWEWAGWGNPIQDISNVLWFVHLHYPNLCRELSGIFLDTYLSYNNIQITEELIKAFCVSKCINILNFINDGDTNNIKEWIKRLEWTIGHNFI